MKITDVIGHKEVEVPDDAEVFIVGDIHGCLTLLQSTLITAGFDYEKDYLFCVGDLIDRGTENMGVLTAFCLYPRWYTVLGNHDLFAFDPGHTWVMNGGLWADEWLVPREDGGMGYEAPNIVRLLKGHPLMITIKHRGERYGVVHAEIPYKKPNLNIPQHKFTELTDNDWDKAVKAVDVARDSAVPFLTWGRDIIKTKLPGTIKNIGKVQAVFHGHSYVRDPRAIGNRVYLDTGGCFKDGKLTIAKLGGKAINFYNNLGTELTMEVQHTEEGDIVWQYTHGQIPI